jgi:UDP-N-acetylglucosamine:LPS N-acetylglucosamine transferase
MMKKKKVLAIASGGGHWVQLRRIMPAFAAYDTAYATVQKDYQQDISAGARFYTVRDATRWDRWGLVVLLWQLLVLILKERPDVIVTTGAAPGFLALRLGKLLCRSRTVWIDSVANVEELSLSGRKIGPHVDLWLTQWPHLAKPEGPQYLGAVI